MKPVTLKKYQQVITDRPFKLSAEQVGYVEAPEGSVMRCAACIHFFRRAIDNFSTCEIFRSPETDAEGVRPDYRCQFWSVDGDVHPFIEAKEELEPSSEEEEESLSDA